MNKKYFHTLLFGVLLAITAGSCKKDSVSRQQAVILPQPLQIGMTEYGSGNYKDIEINVSQVGTKSTALSLLFDTGSGGMVIDATGVLPASMITTNGFNFTGDSVVVDGITITKQTSTIKYGGDNSTTTTVYGNLAYANVTIGDQNGNFTVKRLPFFLYYKGMGSDGKATPAHYFDVIGVSGQYNLTFANGVYITSPLSYYEPGGSIIKGFKLPALGTANFVNTGKYVPGLLTLGLTSGDISSSGFNISQLSFNSGAGYAPFITTKITYNSKTFNTLALYDTGTSPYSLIQDRTVTGNTSTLLPANTQIALSTGSGFNYTYTTNANSNLTQVENPATTGGNITIFGIDFFINNSFLIDYTDHTVGLKNN